MNPGRGGWFILVTFLVALVLSGRHQLSDTWSLFGVAGLGLASDFEPALSNVEYDIEVTDTVFRDLPSVARTAGRVFLPISNGHGAWEMALTNTLSRGDRILVLESGRFAVGWGGMGASMGLTAG